jgi:3-deoxy-manno-octulosonate cytidylyltransferase (CMP-KDO synthetase)
VRFLCVIPARLGSTRLPEKPLRLLAGEPLVRHVARRVAESEIADEVVVATDAPYVVTAVSDLAVRPLLTRATCASGTERVAEVVRRPEYADVDMVLNVQGDEPLVPREALVGALERVANGDDVGTAAGPLSADAWWDPNRVKVSVDGRGRALRFFRSPVARRSPHPETVLHHVGVYAYRRDALLRWVRLPEGDEERAERLEQLRPLAHGMTIGVSRLAEAPPPGVDTAEDLEAMEHLLAAAGPKVSG